MYPHGLRTYEQDPELIHLGESKKKTMDRLINLALTEGEGDSTKKVYQGLNFFWLGDRVIITEDENPGTRKARTAVDFYNSGSIEWIVYYNENNQRHNMDNGAIFKYNEDGSVSHVKFFVKDIRLSKEQFNKVKQLEQDFGDRKKFDCMLDVIVMLSDTIAREHSREKVFR